MNLENELGDENYRIYYRNCTTSVVYYFHSLFPDVLYGIVMWVQNAGPKCGSKMRVQNAGPKCGSIIRVQNAGRKCGSKMGINNAGQECRSKIGVISAGQKCRSKCGSKCGSESGSKYGSKCGSKIRVKNAGQKCWSKMRIKNTGQNAGHMKYFEKSNPGNSQNQNTAKFDKKKSFTKFAKLNTAIFRQNWTPLLK